MNLEEAKALFEKEGYTLLLFNDKETVFSRKRGVRPLLELLGNDYSSYIALDKVIGKGAAFLYLYLGIKTIYVNVISKSALDVLKEGEVKVYYSSLVNRILRHDKNGYCPIEEAVYKCENKEEALPLIINRLKSLKEDEKK